MKPRALAIIALLVLSTISCRQAKAPDDQELDRLAGELARKVVIVDTHIDVPYRLQEKMEDVSVRTEEGHFDYPRAREGGLDAPFMSIYVPASYQEGGGARELADKLIDMVEELAGAHPEKWTVATSVADVRRNFRDGKMSLAMGMENGAPVEGDLENLRHFHDRGIRYITLTHSKNNHICDSSYDEERKWNGLSPFGREVVAEMNRLGIMIDVSHVSDAAFYQVMELARAPVIASHSSCRHFTPGLERNMGDDMIRLLGENGGVIMINFGSFFINNDYRVKWEEHREILERRLAERGLSYRDEAAREHIEAYREEHPIEEKGELSEVVDHIDHVVQLVGVDHVGFGSDFDGVGSLPHGVEDVSRYPALIRELLRRGYSEEDIQKICSGNLLRVWSEVEQVARELQAQG